jgi:hypothetical protein
MSYYVTVFCYKFIICLYRHVLTWNHSLLVRNMCLVQYSTSHRLRYCFIWNMIQVYSLRLIRELSLYRMWTMTRYVLEIFLHYGNVFLKITA